MTLTPVAESLAVELLHVLPVFTTRICRDRGSIPDLPHARRTLYLYATAAVRIILKRAKNIVSEVEAYVKYEQVEPNEVWTCVACSYFIYKNLT